MPEIEVLLKAQVWDINAKSLKSGDEAVITEKTIAPEKDNDDDDPARGVYFNNETEQWMARTEDGRLFELMSKQVKDPRPPKGNRAR